MKRLARFKVWVDEREYRTPMHYVKSEWQREGKSAAYFLFRLVTGIWFLEALVASFFTVQYTPDYWFIYYTHWSFVLATAQSILGLVLVGMNQGGAFNPAGGKHQDVACKVYEWLHAAAMNQAFCVTLLYWSLVYTPKMGPPTFGNIQVHAVNSIVMMLDLLIVAFPIRLINFILPLIISMGYLLFSLIYYLAGGKTSDGKRCIYNAVDWSNRPILTGSFFLLCPLAIMTMHFIIWWISYGKRLAARKLEKRRAAKMFAQEASKVPV